MDLIENEIKTLSPHGVKVCHHVSVDAQGNLWLCNRENGFIGCWLGLGISGDIERLTQPADHLFSMDVGCSPFLKPMVWQEKVGVFIYHTHRQMILFLSEKGDVTELTRFPKKYGRVLDGVWGGHYVWLVTADPQAPLHGISLVDHAAVRPTEILEVNGFGALSSLGMAEDGRVLQLAFSKCLVRWRLGSQVPTPWLR
ncbi:hypothetical protein [Magnetococcus sp. PR-3]|uniref:hypothetical protein n=1 Tax=Magnetococcus sp. PR-3 TaxID=3120355 RepID=UPI002FCE5807